MKRLIVSDFDGTVYRKDDLRHMARVIESIRRFEPQTVFAVASGRPLHLLKMFFSSVPGVYIISNDGALITHGDKILYEKPIDCSLIAKRCKELDWVAYGECISYMKVNEKSLALKFVKMFNSHVVKAQDINNIEENIYKIFFTNNMPDINGLKKSYEQYRICEFMAADADKGKAAVYLAKLLGIADEDIIAFGDNENDIPLFKAAGKSYAYAGASPAVRACADGVFSDLTERIREYEKL